jgi:hypothetical protein
METILHKNHPLVRLNKRTFVYLPQKKKHLYIKTKGNLHKKNQGQQVWAVGSLGPEVRT